MNWWDSLAGNKQYPSVPEREGGGDGNVRYPAAMLCGLLGFVLMASALVAAFMGASSMAGWAVVLALVCIALAHVLLPSDKPSK